MAKFIEGDSTPVEVAPTETLLKALRTLSPRSSHLPYPHDKLSYTERQALTVVSSSTIHKQGVNEFSLGAGSKMWEVATAYGSSGDLETLEIRQRRHFDVIDAKRGAHYRVNIVREVHTATKRVPVFKGYLPL